MTSVTCARHLFVINLYKSTWIIVIPRTSIFVNKRCVRHLMSLGMDNVGGEMGEDNIILPHIA